MGLKAWLENGFNIVLIGIIIYNLSKVPALEKHPHLNVANQTLLNEDLPLLNSSAVLNESGFSNRPFKYVNRSQFGSVILGISYLSFLKYRKQDKFFFFNSNYILVASINENFYSTSANVLLFNRQKKTISEEALTNFAWRKSNELLNANSHLCHPSNYSLSKNNLEFHTKISNTASDPTSLSSKLKENCLIAFDLNGGEAIKNLSFVLHNGFENEWSEEVYPISAEGKHWLHTTKSGSLQAALTIDEKTKVKGVGIASFVRGLSYYKTIRLTGLAVGRAKNLPFSLNFGIFSTHNSTKVNEDSFILDGATHRLDPLHIKYDKLNFMNGFTISTFVDNTNLEEETVESKPCRAEFVFRTVYHHNSGFNYFLVKKKVDTVFGEVSGWVSDEAGVKYSFEDIPAVIEIADLKGN